MEMDKELIDRHKLVEIRTRVKNGLQHLALNRGVRLHRMNCREVEDQSSGRFTLHHQTVGGCKSFCVNDLF